MSKGEVRKIDIREDEEVGIGISIFEEGIVEMEGTSTWENGIYEDVGVVWDVWGINEEGREKGGVVMRTYDNTDQSLEVSSRMGFKSK